jgi:uncharacterized glyoxalase superfamily protein PhnB
MPATIKQVVPVLPVANMLDSLGWWTAVCGFNELFRHTEDATYVGIVRQGIELHLALVTDPETARTTGRQTMIRFHIDDLDTFYADFKRRGGLVPANGELQIKPWGAREFGAYDPNGVCVAFMQL